MFCSITFGLPCSRTRFTFCAVTTALSPFRQRAAKGMITGYIFNGYRRLSSQFIYWSIPFALGKHTTTVEPCSICHPSCRTTSSPLCLLFPVMSPTFLLGASTSLPLDTALLCAQSQRTDERSRLQHVRLGQACGRVQRQQGGSPCGGGARWRRPLVHCPILLAPIDSCLDHFSVITS
jgi:hypothetical protein